MTKRRQRLGKGAVGGPRGFLIAVVPALLTLTVLLVGGLDPRFALGIALGQFAFVSFGISQYQARRPQPRRVLFLAKSRSPFARNIFRGLRDGLEDYGAIAVSGLYPEENEDPRTFQLAQLESLEIARADGLVVIPATDDERLWTELTRIVGQGTLVVCVDTKPPNHVFRNLALRPPAFVGSDFTLGGRMVGRFFAEHLSQAEHARLVVALGPESSWPGRERGSWILYELGVAGLLDRCHTVELPDWTALSCAEKLHDVVDAIAAGGCEEVFVFAGNDKVAHALHQLLDTRGWAHPEVHIVGYDGTTTEDGRHLLDGLARARATVNALPVKQGMAAAEFIALAYERRDHSVTKRIVAPELVAFGTRAD